MSIGRGIRTTVAIAAVLLAVAVAASAGAAAPVKADKHDRALIKQLLAQAAAFEPGGPDAELTAIAEACPAWSTDPAVQLRLTAALLYPAAFRLFDRSEATVVAYRARIGRMRPHAKAFRDWIAVERVDTTNAIAFLRRFDSSRLDVCAFVEAVVAAGDNQDAVELALLRLFPHPDDLGALIAYGEADEALEARRKSASTRFAAFLKRSGYTRAQIGVLTGG